MYKINFCTHVMHEVYYFGHYYVYDSIKYKSFLIFEYIYIYIYIYKIKIFLNFLKNMHLNNIPCNNYFILKL